MKTTLTAPVRTSGPLEEPLRNRLRRRLLALNYHAFAQCLCLLLERVGYEDVRVSGRVNWKGRNCEGGYDIEAYLPAGVGRRKVIVQIKQFDTLPVYQRSIDELRGTCLRAEAAEALLITTSTFSPVVLRRAGAVGVQVAPVRLVDGAELLDLLILHRVGVWEEVGDEETDRNEGTTNKSIAGQRGRIGLDSDFFEGLSRTYAGNGRRSMRQPLPGTKTPLRLLTIQVDLRGVGRRGPLAERGER